MSKEFRDVVEFNQEIINLTPAEYLSEERLNWFKTVINEELSEFEEANTKYVDATIAKLSEDTLLELKADMIDAIMDLLYFAYGRLYEIGCTENDFNCMWNAIQTANMSKKRGNKGRGSDDDAIKPEGWKGPEQTFIEYRKALQKQLDTCEQTTCNELHFFKPDTISAPKTTSEPIKIAKGRETSLDDYLNNDCTVPSSDYAEFDKQATIGTVNQLHLPGMKYDDGKPNLSLVLGGFYQALLDVGYIGTFGAKKYTPNGWKEVDNAQERYESALLRHTLAAVGGNPYDSETGHLHLAHAAWNALALTQIHFMHQPLSAFNDYIALCKNLENSYFENLKGKNKGNNNG